MKIYIFLDKTKSALRAYCIILVGPAGIEPARVIHPRDFKSLASTSFTTSPLEVPARFELAITELQSIALPLG